MKTVLFWLAGGLEGRGWTHVQAAAVFVLPGVALLVLLGRPLDVLSLGEDEAASLGLPVRATRLGLLGLAALVAGACTAVAGSVPFVGLMAPARAAPARGTAQPPPAARRVPGRRPARGAGRPRRAHAERALRAAARRRSPPSWARPTSCWRCARTRGADERDASFCCPPTRLAVERGRRRVLDGRERSSSTPARRWPSSGRTPRASRRWCGRWPGLLEPAAGEVRLCGRPLGDWPRDARARVLALATSEEEGPDALTVGDRVALGRYPHRGPFRPLNAADDAAVARALEQTGIAPPRPQRRLGTLSAGERQLATLARGLAQEPRVLLLDEPAAHLDIGHQLQLFRTLDEVRRCGVGGAGRRPRPRARRGVGGAHGAGRRGRPDRRRGHAGRGARLDRGERGLRGADTGTRRPDLPHLHYTFGDGA